MLQMPQIMEMSALSKQEILRALIKIFNQSEVERFTLIIKQAPLRDSQNKQEFGLKVDELEEALTMRPKSSTIDRYYRTRHFINHQKSMPGNHSSSSSSLSDDSQLPESPKELGLKLYRLGEYSQALLIFEELKEQFPLQNRQQQYRKQYREILNNLGNCYFRLNQHQEAVATYKQLIKQCNSDDLTCREEKIRGRLYNNLGCCYGKLGYEKLSMSSYTEALKIYNKYSSIDCSSLLYNIANIYFNCQMYDTSEKYYEQAILERQLKKPNEKMLLYHAYSKLSAAQIRQRKCKDALENLGKALKLAENGCGDALEILRQCAYVKQLEERWEQALQFYEKMHTLHEQLNKSKGSIFESVAKIYLNLGKMAEHKKYIALSLEEYRRDGNERKVSELSSSWTQKMTR